MSERKTDYPIDSQFTNRWSPRAFSKEEISNETLMTGFEAARWAPSSGNSQPWHFVYSRRGTSSWEQFTQFLVEGNRVWADKAAALIVVLSRKEYKRGDKIIKSDNQSFDTGAAWMSFALELNKLGWYTHGMAGIVNQKIVSELGITEGFNVECMVAVGKIGDKNELPEHLRSRELQSDRKPAKKFVSESIFETEWTKPE